MNEGQNIQEADDRAEAEATERLVRDDEQGPGLVIHDNEAFLNGRTVTLTDKELVAAKNLVVAALKRELRDEAKRIEGMRSKRKRRTKAEMAAARAEAAESHTDVKPTRRKREAVSA